MRPEQTPRAADLETMDDMVVATFDGIAKDGSDVRIRTAVSVHIPVDPGCELPVVARYVLRDLHSCIEDDYVGLDGGAYFPTWHACRRSMAVDYQPHHAAAALNFMGASGILPGEDVLQTPPRHRISGRLIQTNDVLKPGESIEDYGWMVDLASLRPSIEEVRAAAARLVLRQGEGAKSRTLVRAPLPKWVHPRHDEASRPVLVIPSTDDMHRTVTGFGHDRLDEALAYAQLPSVRGRRQLAPPSGTIEIGEGWASDDDLVWIARIVGRHWIRDIDPIVAQLSARGVAAWHLGANAEAAIATEGRKGAEAVLSGLLLLRDEIAQDPALADYAFFVNKTRELADRLVHIEGMNTRPSLSPAVGSR